jgi:acetylornithine deacetylase/succinyl-diaminopimelate desuccinylase-like protein
VTDTTTANRDEAVRAAVRDGFPAAVAALGDLIRIPSIAFDGFPREEVTRSAEAVAERFRALGVFQTVEVRTAWFDGEHGREEGNPAVVARRDPAPGRPTVLLYAHHDVQPPGRDDAWASPPFEPTVRGERLFGRGASDDKAGVVAHLAAITAVTEVLGPDLGLGLAVFIEGEEEAGSSSFEAFLAENRDLLAADVIVVADSDNPSTTTPGLTTTLRGNALLTLTVSTLEHASHSGMYGGAVPDAMLATLKLLATLWDERGDVAVAGLRRTGEPGPSDEQAEQALVQDAALLPGVTPIGTGSVADRLWRSPAITVTGIDAPDVRNASNTLASSVRVRISTRVAPGQTGEEALAALRAHLEAHAPFGAALEFSGIDVGDPFLADLDGWAAGEARRALADGWGVEAELTGIGGSIPFLAVLTRTFPDAQILITGVEDPDTRAHAPNESQHLGALQRAITAEALLLARVAERTIEP